MANSLISMIKGDSTLINNTGILDGQILFNTDEKTISLDDGGVRANYGNSADNINKNLAYIENGNTATRGYSAGAFIVWKGQLYRALVQINSGTAFSVGTNMVADTAGAELTQISADTSWYGTSSTAAGTTAKIATTTDSKFTLVTGAKVRIKFTYANTASAPTLNVDSKGAKSIKAYGTTAPTMWWKAGDVVDFTYDGTNWIMGSTQGQIEQINSDLSVSHRFVTLYTNDSPVPMGQGTLTLSQSMSLFKFIFIICDREVGKDYKCTFLLDIMDNGAIRPIPMYTNNDDGTLLFRRCIDSNADVNKLYVGNGEYHGYDNPNSGWTAYAGGLVVRKVIGIR